VQVTSGTATLASFSYDGLGRRTEKLTLSGMSDYYLAGQQVVETDFTPSGGGGTSALQYQYVWSPRYIDAPVLRDDFTSGSTYPHVYYLDDANFNVTTLIGSDGGVIERTVYDAYGTPTFYNSTWTGSSTTSSVGNVVLYTGRELDPETGLYYYRARYYSPGLGRFIGRDPLDYWGGDFNLYRYVRNGPANAVDPLGLVTDWVIGPNTDIISWIEETKGASALLNSSANPEPPLNFLGSPAKLKPGEDRRSLGSFKSTKEYRNVHELQLTLCCESGKVVTVSKVLHQDVGYTPIRVPVVGTTYSEGRSGPPTVQETPTPKGETCYKVTSVQRFRLGWASNVAGRSTQGYWAPYAWSRIEYELCCDGTAKIKFGGSFVPSHSFYIDFQRVGQHSMANQPTALKRLDDFIQAGDAKDAPGAEKL